MLDSGELRALAAQVDAPAVQTVLLVGSFARGDAGPYSDVDLLRLVPSPLPDAGSRLWQGRLLNVSDADPETVEAWFTEPQGATEVILGLRNASVLCDRADVGKALRARAEAFVWTPTLQEKADVWASAQLVGWAEEAHKGLSGLRTGDTGRLLNAQFGLSWGLAKTVRVQRGLLAGGDNTFLTDLEAVFPETTWFRLLRGAYGLTGLNLAGQVRAGLELYKLTAELLDPALNADDRPIITHTVRLIEKNR